jgi:hypothetical protein
LAANVSAPAVRVALTVAGLGEARVAEGLSTGLGGGQGGLRALADDFALTFGKGCEKVQRERLYVRP